MSKFQVIDYYDVWYNGAEECYEVNDLSRLMLFVDINDEDTDTDIIDKLVDAGYFQIGIYDLDYMVSWLDDSMIEVSYIMYNGDIYPLCRLEKTQA